jgi:hypothetical protein
MGVVNPSRLVEEFIPHTGSVDDVDVTFYERLFNNEIMAGSYLAKRTAYTLEFLHYWADYYYRVQEKDFHGWDNGVINVSRAGIDYCIKGSGIEGGRIENFRKSSSTRFVEIALDLLGGCVNACGKRPVHSPLSPISRAAHDMR